MNPVRDQRAAANTPRPHRLPFPRRRHEARQAARQRIASWVARRCAPVAQATGGLSERSRRARDGWIGTAALLGSAFIHGSLATLAAFGGGEPGTRSPSSAQAVAIEVRARAAPEVEHARPSPKEPSQAQAAPRSPRKIRASAREPAPGPQPAPNRAPIVGISFEATVEGAAGPAFAVGESRAGATPARAEKGLSSSSQGSANKVAGYLPGTGASFAPPRRKRPSRAPYPDTLKAQGVEADVTVSVALDAMGRVERVVIVSPAPFDELNESARRAALSEEFEPATRNGVAIPYTVNFTYRFRLEEP